MNGLYPSVFPVGNQLALLFPRIIIGLALFVAGLLLAKLVKRSVRKVVSVLVDSSLIKNTPIEHFFGNADLTQRIDAGLGSVAYWFTILLTTYVVTATVGLTSVSYLLEQVFNYVPRFLSAIIVLVIGLLLAGFVESASKTSLSKIDVKMARIIGKLASYTVMVLAVMVAFSELGIAKDFILILFVGLVSSISLGIGLAVGLGGQHVVRQVFERWSETQEQSKSRTSKR